jgi:hypothetical protein
MPRSNRKTRKNKKGGALPLITYTPRYHELEYKRGPIGSVYTPSYYSTPGQQFGAIDLTFEYRHHISQPYTSITIYALFPPGPLSEQQKQYLDSWYPVYGFILENSGYPFGRILDNYGSIHEIGTALLVNKPSVHIMGATVPSNLKPLPDSFIDAKVKQMACQQMTYNREYPNPPITINLPQESMFKVKPLSNVKPHRVFESSSDLAEYILELEKKAGVQTSNAEIQTNTPNTNITNTIQKTVQTARNKSKVLSQLKLKHNINNIINNVYSKNKKGKNSEIQTNLTAPVLGNTTDKKWAEPAGRNFQTTFLTAVNIPKKEEVLRINNI